MIRQKKNSLHIHLWVPLRKTEKCCQGLLSIAVFGSLQAAAASFLNYLWAIQNPRSSHLRKMKPSEVSSAWNHQHTIAKRCLRDFFTTACKVEMLRLPSAFKWPYIFFPNKFPMLQPNAPFFFPTHKEQGDQFITLLLIISCCIFEGCYCLSDQKTPVNSSKLLVHFNVWVPWTEYSAVADAVLFLHYIIV